MCKPALFILMACLIATPAIASAADATPAPASAASCRPSSQQTKQLIMAVMTMAKSEIPLMIQDRTQMLDALTPDHRASVGKVMDDLLVSPHPDPAAAAKTIDAMLTPGEQQSIRSSAASLVGQTMTLVQGAIRQYQSAMGMQPKADASPTPFPTSSLNSVGVGTILVGLLGPTTTLAGLSIPGMTQAGSSPSQP